MWQKLMHGNIKNIYLAQVMNTDKLYYAAHQIMLDIDKPIDCLYKASFKYQLNAFKKTSK